MIACTDVYYTEDHAVAACLLVHDWADDVPCLELMRRIEKPAAYEPGWFYRRELPALLLVLGSLPRRPELIIIDGYVWLGHESRPGLGAYLHEALRSAAAVIGVAKTLFKGGPAVRSITRGASVRPLYVTAVGMAVDEAADQIRIMHGNFRIPTLLKRVDRFCRATQGERVNHARSTNDTNRFIAAVNNRLAPRR